MLVGKSYNKIDQQRRLTIPKNMRSDLGETAMLTRGLDGGIFLLPATYWNKLVNNLVNQPFTKRRARDFWRYMSNDAYEVNLDRIGRITLPQSLSDFADIKEKVVVVGSLQYIEIWDQKRYNHYFDELAQKAEEIAEELPWSNDPDSSTRNSTPSSNLSTTPLEGKHARSSND